MFHPYLRVGLGYLTHLHVTNGFDRVLILVDDLTRMSHFLLCTKSKATKEANLFYKESTINKDFPECWLVIAIRNRFARFGDALERDSTCTYIANNLRLGIDGIVDVLQVHFAAISGTFRIRGLRNYHEIRRYSPDDIIDP
jgi:hypothetical protein